MQEFSTNCSCTWCQDRPDDVFGVSHKSFFVEDTEVRIGASEVIRRTPISAGKPEGTTVVETITPVLANVLRLQVLWALLQDARDRRHRDGADHLGRGPDVLDVLIWFRDTLLYGENTCEVALSGTTVHETNHMHSVMGLEKTTDFFLGRSEHPAEIPAPPRSFDD